MSAKKSASFLPQAKPAKLGLSPQRLADLQTTLQARIERQHLPGAVMLIARHGQLAVLQALGAQDPQQGTPMQTDSIFRIYSMTKPIVSVAAMMLMEQGRLMLNDPVAKYLPEFSSQRVAEFDAANHMTLRAPKRAATVQDLLRHTAGLTYQFTGDGPLRQLYADANVRSVQRSNEEFSQTLATIPLMFDPGRMWEYSHATDVLGRLVEVISGQRLGEFLQQHILTPLGMHDTGFVVPPDQHGRIAEAFAQDPDGGALMRLIDHKVHNPMESGGGGLASTALDYARFLQFMLNRGELDGVRLLSPSTVALMTSDHLGTIPVNGSPDTAMLPAGHGFGLGFAVRTHAGLAPLPGSVGMYYWSGIAGTSFFVDPALDLFAILLTQAPNQRDLYRPLFRQMVYAALLD
jgi:CubicO group peptidase (beta-lactamase class C family)